jgi:hypothetical protein
MSICLIGVDINCFINMAVCVTLDHYRVCRVKATRACLVTSMVCKQVCGTELICLRISLQFLETLGWAAYRGSQRLWIWALSFLQKRWDYDVFPRRC